MSKLPQKSFDSQLHIIRDVHFDVGKYKIGELYVINHMVHPNYLHFGEPCKTVGYLKTASEHSLQFRTMKRCEICNDTDAVYYTYTIDDFTLTIDEIIDKEIEIERLLTETEAAMYLAGVMLKDSTKKAANELLGYGQETTYTSEDLKKYDAMLGYGKASHDNFWKDFRNCKSQQELKAAYKIDEDTAKECVNFGEMAKEIAVRDMAERMNYIVYPKGQQPMSMFENNGTTFDVESFMNLSGIVKITMKKKDSAMVVYTDAKNIRVVFDTIEIRNKRGTIHMNFNIANILSMFDNIIFEDQQ